MHSHCSVPSRSSSIPTPIYPCPSRPFFGFCGEFCRGIKDDDDDWPTGGWDEYPPQHRHRSAPPRPALPHAHRPPRPTGHPSACRPRARPACNARVCGGWPTPRHAGALARGLGTGCHACSLGKPAPFRFVPTEIEIRSPAHPHPLPLAPGLAWRPRRPSARAAAMLGVGGVVRPGPGYGTPLGLRGPLRDAARRLAGLIRHTPDRPPPAHPTPSAAAAGAAGRSRA